MCRIFDKTLREEITKTLKYYIRMILMWNPFDVNNIVKMLGDIFQQDAKFYQDGSTQSFSAFQVSSSTLIKKK